MAEENREQQDLEFESLKSIYNNEMTVLKKGQEFLIDVTIMGQDAVSVQLQNSTQLLETDVGGSVCAPPPPLLPRTTSTSSVKRANITHFPPITLYIRYHDNYPSHECPQFHLSARWLNQKYVDKLNDKLRELFTPCWPVVYDWINYISNDLLQYYCQLQNGASPGLEEMESEQILTRHPNQIFVRSLSELNDIEEHNHYEMYKEFLEEKHECGICLDLKFGHLFCDPCKDCVGPGLFCKDCVKEYCQTLLSEGRVTNLTCPCPTCSKMLSDVLVKSLLTSKQFQKYVHLREEVHLDSIPGMVFCPRSICGARVVSEPQSDLAVCNECNFPFCKICRQTWHGIESCPALSKIEVNTEDNEDIVKEKPKSQEDTQRRIDELKSMLWLRSHRNVKQCPKCNTIIQKIGGCNKMTCWKCGAYFCWLCGEQIAGYVHFDATTCELFRAEDYLPPQEEKESKEASANLPDQEDQLKNLLESACPRCGLVEQKTSNNNWVNCRRCRLPFCLMCHEPCFGRYHFNEYGCKEFTSLEEDMLRQLENKQETT